MNKDTKNIFNIQGLLTKFWKTKKSWIFFTFWKRGIYVYTPNIKYSKVMLWV